MSTSLHNTFSKNQQSASLLLPALTSKNAFKGFLFICVLNIFLSVPAFADYTVPSGSNINATAITTESGVLTINGTLTISSNVSLLNFTSIVVNAPNGQIYWTNNSDLTFSSGTAIAIYNGALGLQPTVGNGNASQRLVVGTTVISVSSDNSNNAAFSFEQFNALGGLPQFTLTGSASVCEGSTIALTITPDRTFTSNYTYIWSGTPTVTFSSNTANAASSATTNITPAANTYTITCTVKVADDLLATKSITVTVKSAGEWKGITTNWNDGQNWCTGIAPTAGTNVTIPVTANNPIVTAGNAFVNNLTIALGASLTLNGGNLKIAGSVSSTKAIIVTNGIVELNGSASQAIAGSNFYANTVKDLTINNPIGVVVSSVANDSLKISGALVFGNVNNSTVYTGDNIVLVSNSAGTARVADVSNNGVNTGNNFNGKVNVQRYFPARRAWRLFTAPLAGAGSIFDNWQNKGAYQAGVGTYVTGAGATNTTGANGLDWSPLNNSSLKAGSTLTAVTNTRTTLLSKNLADTADNNAFFIFVRGDRDAANTNPSLSNNTIVNSIGKLQIGRQTFPVSSLPSGYTLVGNPYASPVDFGKLVRNNVSNRFYVWDPYLNAEQGGYVLIDDADGNGTYTASPSSPGGMSKILQSGQAFYVQTVTSNAASVTFQENAKPATTASLTAFRPVGMEQSLRVNIYNTNAANSLQLLDGVYAAFDNSFSKEVDMLDGVKFGNVKEMLAILRNTKTLALERRPELTTDDTLFLALTKTTQRSYQLEFLPIGFEPSLLMVLEDNYTGIKTTLSPVQKTVYNFVINSAVASAAANRFRVVFKQVIANTLPVTIRDFKASKQSNNVAVNWTVENEINLRSYEVQRSVDGINFSTIATTKAIGENRSTTAYQIIDADPASSNNYYRLRSIDLDGKYEYSKTVVAKMAEQVAGLRIYPNPVTDGVIGVEFKNMSVGTYNTRLTNAGGQTISSQQVNLTTASGMEYIHQGFKLVAGIYQLEVVGPDNTVTIVKVIAR